MPWVRSSDTASQYPRLLAVDALPDAPPGAVPMMRGFIQMLAEGSAAYLTDYLVDAGTVRRAGGEMHQWLTTAALRTGLLTKHRKKIHGVSAFKVIDDPEFIHIRERAEVEWERQQRAETLDLRLSIPVRLRDGDLCRYCGVITYGPGRKSPRKRTLDHIVGPDADGNRAPATVDTLVVACLGCNSEMRDKAGEDRAPLKAPPHRPFYSKSTAQWLTTNGRPTLPTDATDSDPAPAGPRAEAPARQRPATADTARAADSDPAPAGPRAARTTAPPAPPDLDESLLDPVVEDRESSGTGRDGAGSEALYPTGSTGTPARRRRRRSSRGRSPAPSSTHPTEVT